MLTNKLVAKETNGSEDPKKRIITPLMGKISCTFIIPRAFTKGGIIDEPGQVIVEKVEDGLLIRKL